MHSIRTISDSFGNFVHLFAYWSATLPTLHTTDLQEAYYLNEIIGLYMKHMLESVVHVQNGKIEDPLDEEEPVVEQLELFKSICCFQYELTCEITILYGNPPLAQLNSIFEQKWAAF